SSPISARTTGIVFTLFFVLILFVLILFFVFRATFLTLKACKYDMASTHHHSTHELKNVRPEHRICPLTPHQRFRTITPHGRFAVYGPNACTDISDRPSADDLVEGARYVNLNNAGPQKSQMANSVTVKPRFRFPRRPARADVGGIDGKTCGRLYEDSKDWKGKNVDGESVQKGRGGGGRGTGRLETDGGAAEDPQS
ncbi:MAG: hypothetical protein FE78DRAFT_472151, partial [Acidomyces sp. 'richmondensis']